MLFRSVAWRVLDAEHTGASGYPSGIPQRRRRVWLVGHLGADWQRPAGVLFDGEIDAQYHPPHGHHAPPAAAGGKGDHPAICISGNLAFHRQSIRSRSPAWQYRAAQTITCTDLHVIIADGVVRRLMPVEEERLFGFPDDYTAIRYRGAPASSYARHNVLGNSWAVNCARWVCERIGREIAGTLQ